MKKNKQRKIKNKVLKLSSYFLLYWVTAIVKPNSRGTPGIRLKKKIIVASLGLLGAAALPAVDQAALPAPNQGRKLVPVRSVRVNETLRANSHVWIYLLCL